MMAVLLLCLACRSYNSLSRYKHHTWCVFSRLCS